MLTRCQHCNTPVFEYRDGLVIVKIRHHGEWHTSMFRLEDLQEQEADRGMVVNHAVTAVN